MSAAARLPTFLSASSRPHSFDTTARGDVCGPLSFWGRGSFRWFVRSSPPSGLTSPANAFRIDHRRQSLPLLQADMHCKANINTAHALVESSASGKVGSNSGVGRLNDQCMVSITLGIHYAYTWRTGMITDVTRELPRELPDLQHNPQKYLKAKLRCLRATEQTNRFGCAADIVIIVEPAAGGLNAI
jgi:hypothetical protein